MHQIRRGSQVRTRPPRGIAWAVTIAAIAAVAATGACLLNTETTLCETSGLICPPGWRCAAAQDVCIPNGGCGDGIKSPDEVCDDGNVLPGDSCSPDCQSDKPCGDGVVDPGEECDNGAADSTTCNSNCKVARCGDGYLNRAAGEECDSGGEDTAECNGHLCKLPVCGDRYYNPEFTLPVLNVKEQCDSGGVDTLACDSDCTAPLCGDGHYNSEYSIPGQLYNEQCDPGIMIMGVPQDSMNCDSDCTLIVCGDKHLNMAAGEECDDGNADTTDDCPKGGQPDGACKKARCGDGYIWKDVESCDPDIMINGIPQDSMNCDSDCTPVVCGDGHPNMAAGEECDTGGMRSNTIPDACRLNCHNPSCGDGVKDTGETCDKGGPGIPEVGCPTTQKCNMTCTACG